MLYDSDNFEAVLDAASADDAELKAELKEAFAASLETQIDRMRRARCDGNWEVAVERIKGLAAGFCADELLLLSEEALDSAPGDPVILRKLEAYRAQFDC